MHAASEKKLAVSNDGVGAWLGALLYTPSAPKRPPETGMSMHADLLLLDDKAGETQRCKASA